MAQCPFPDCDKPVATRGHCQGHYLQLKKGKELKPLGGHSLTRGLSTPERFAFYTDKTETCWNWVGTLNEGGYGLLRVEGGNVLTHRYAFEVDNEPIPDGMFVDHICRNRLCVNPDHLRIVTNGQNSENRCPTGNKNNTSGYRGVAKHKGTGKWQVHLMYRGVTHSLGLFEDVHEAGAVAKENRLELLTHSDGR